MLSYDLPHSAATNQVAFDQQDLHSSPEFQHLMDRHAFRYDHFYLTDFTKEVPLHDGKRNLPGVDVSLTMFHDHTAQVTSSNPLIE